MECKKVSTADRILQSALQLMKDKGFKSVTIKDIAVASNVSEMTVYRHFETKRRVLEEAIKKNSHHFGFKFKEIFDKKIVWELEQDLQLIAKSYLDLMENNQSICLIAVQERLTMPELVGIISENTERLQNFLSVYFKEMQEKKKMAEVDVHAKASAFFTMLFGFFLSTALWGDEFIKESKDNFISNSVHTFCNGIKK